METRLSPKQSQRAQARALRDSLPETYRHQASADICAQLMQLPQVAESEKFSIYLSTGSEVETDAIVQALLEQGKQVYAPRCGAKGQMECYRIDDVESIRPGAYGIREPQPQHKLDAPQVIIVPALAFDKKGQRIGYGGGYYDRYLARYPQAYTIGLCFARCLHQQVAVDAWDRPVSLVLTERS